MKLYKPEQRKLLESGEERERRQSKEIKRSEKDHLLLVLVG